MAEETLVAHQPRTSAVIASCSKLVRPRYQRLHAPLPRVRGLVTVPAVRYLWCMGAAAKLFEEAMQLPDAEREELAAALLDSLEPRPGISIEDRDEIERRAEDARTRVPGIPWEEVQRDLLKK
ncbi:MAG: addiction module protein [Polyangiaceae bacterium]|nr:addiction module protein [Polyangiaceae bacterium]